MVTEILTRWNFNGPSPWPLPALCTGNLNGAGRGIKGEGAVHSVVFGSAEPIGSSGESLPQAEPTTPATPSPTSPVAPPTITPPQLDRAIQETIQQRKYTWRAPREKMAQPENTDKGVIRRFLDGVLKTFQRWAKSFGEWLRKLFQRQGQAGQGTSGYGWMVSLQILLYLLAAAVVAALVILLYRVLRDRQRRGGALPSEPIQPTPDLSDENLGAEQLPEDGWMKLARELLERGELRLALRAFYLASLAHLAGRNLISLAKFKSNRDYERELRRRGHSFPTLLSRFGENVSVFDRTWYGLHEINGELVNQFAANVEQIKIGT